MSGPVSTLPPGEDSDPRIELPSFGFVIGACPAEPHRVGEVGLVPFFDDCLLGGEEDARTLVVRFARQRPNETLVAENRGTPLGEPTFPEDQLMVRATALGLEIVKVGYLSLLVNGKPQERARLLPGDTVLLGGKVLLICVRRPKTLPSPREKWDPDTDAFRPHVPHPFGEADAAGMVGESAGAWELRCRVAHAAQRHNNHVFIWGESGTGKALVSRRIHDLSSRAARPFVPIDAYTFMKEDPLIGLWGTAAGHAGLGMPAVPGVLAQAEHGTVFLDEMGDCSHSAQGMWHHVLDCRDYRARGDTVLHADVRVICASSRDRSSFRDEFVYRFVVQIRIPPLRERPDDIPLIIRHRLLELGRERSHWADRFFGTRPTGEVEPRISAALVDHLVRHPLPRNVRQLDELLVKACQSSKGDEIALGR